MRESGQSEGPFGGKRQEIISKGGFTSSELLNRAFQLLVNTRLVGGGYSVLVYYCLKMIKIKLFGIVALMFGFILFLGFTSPNNATLVTYAGAFLIIYVLSLLVVSVVLDLAYGSINQKMRFFIAAVIAFSPTALIALSSLSTISIIDVIFAIFVPAAIVWYSLKNNSVK